MISYSFHFSIEMFKAAFNLTTKVYFIVFLIIKYCRSIINDKFQLHSETLSAWFTEILGELIHFQFVSQRHLTTLN